MKPWIAAFAITTSVLLAAGSIPASVRAQPPVAVPVDLGPESRVYQAVESLARDGLILGYKDGGFLGGRTLTRYEVASLVKRVVDNLAQKQRVKAEAKRAARAGVNAASPQDASRTTTGTPAGAAAVAQQQTAPLVTRTQFQQVAFLVQEMKPEMAVIGTDMQQAEATLQSLQEEVRGLQDVLAGQRLELDTMNQARTQTRVDGYIQGRYTQRATRQRSLAPENTPQDTSRGLTGNESTFQVRRARINIRGDVTERASYRVQLDARTAPTTGADEITVKEAYVTIKNFPFKIPPRSGGGGGDTQTAPAAGQQGTPESPGTTGGGSQGEGAAAAAPGGIADNRGLVSVDLTLGQQVTPFGYYLQFSSSDREAPERYIGFSDAGAGLFPNQDYDKGVSLNGLIRDRIVYQLGFYNGNGVSTNDLGRRKDFIGRIGLPLTPTWDVGISGYDGKGATTDTTTAGNPSATPNPNPELLPGTGLLTTRPRVKSLFGLDTQFYFPFGASLKAEYVRGKGGLIGANAGAQLPSALRPYADAAAVEAYYVQAAYNSKPNLTLALGYDYFCRNTDPAQDGPFSTVTVGSGASAEQRRLSRSNFVEERLGGGVLYYLDSATRLRFWYETPLNYPNLPGQGDALAHTGFYTAEIQVRF